MIHEALAALIREAIPIWQSGGWGMYALALDALVIFALGLNIFFRLLEKGSLAKPSVAWSKWKRSPDLAVGPLSRIIRGAMEQPSLEAMERYFAELHQSEFSPFDRDLRVMKVAVAVAPLLGLLGTVTGMLTTFRGLAEGGGGEKTMSVIASGISEALITTETGLVLGLGGLIFQFVLTRQHEKFDKMIATLESHCQQEWLARAASSGAALRSAA
jgi:biopolymer transport protein ExbB